MATKSKPVKIEVQSMTDELAEAIKNIDNAMQAIANSEIKQSTIIVLLKDYLGQRIRKDQIQDVLFGLNNLKSTYLKEKKNG